MIELGADLNFATIGNVIMSRDAGEPVPAFRARARETALDLGAEALIFGRLDPMVWVDDEPAANEAAINEGEPTNV